MTRYFMSIPEACRLVLSAASRGRGGELFVLDMGRPLRILDLAARVIERAGLRPGEDVPILFCGARPGEKLTEQLLFTSELQRPSGCDGVWSVEVDDLPYETLAAALDELLAVARGGDDVAVRRRLAAVVPEYRPAAAAVDDAPLPALLLAQA
jgi:FlaA1/EpsC-like NDP-sugar epimerase